MQPCGEAIAGDHDIDMEKLQMQNKAWTDFACEIAAAVCEISCCMLQVGSMFASSICNLCWPFCSVSNVPAIGFVSILQPCWEAIAGDPDINMEKLQMQNKAWADVACKIAAVVCETSCCMLQVGSMFASRCCNCCL